MKRAPVVVLSLAVMFISACGSDEETPNTTAATTPSVTTDESTPPSSSVLLRESCPQVEAALPKGFLPAASKWQAYAQELAQISEAGDLETQNALTGLQEAVDMLAADPASGEPFVDAQQALISALDNVAKRCKAVGSSALQ